MEENNRNNGNEGKTLAELRDEMIDEMGKNLFHLNNDMHLIFEVSRFREYIRALVLQILDEDSIGEEKGEDEYEMSSMEWAKKYFDKIDSIFKKEEDLARYVRKLRARYEPTKRDIQKSRKTNWSASLLRMLIFKDVQQWLKSNKIKYKWVCDLFGTTEISEVTFKNLKKDYKYYGY